MDGLLEATAASGAPRERTSDQTHQPTTSDVDAGVSVSETSNTPQGKRAGRKEDHAAGASESLVAAEDASVIAVNGSEDAASSADTEINSEHVTESVVQEESVVEAGGGGQHAIVTTTTTTTTTVTVKETKSLLRGGVERAVVEFIRHGGSVTAAAAKFGLSRTDVSKIVKDAAESAPSLANAAAAAVAFAAAGSGGSESDEDPDMTEEEESAAITTRPAAGDDQKQSTRKRKSAGADDAGAGSEHVTPPKAKSPSDDSPMDSAGKSKRVRKSKEEKLAILYFVEQGGTHVAAAEKFGISRTAVTKMVKDKEVIWSKVSKQFEAADLSYTTPPAQALELPASESFSEGQSEQQVSSLPSEAGVATGVAVEVPSSAAASASAVAAADVAAPKKERPSLAAPPSGSVPNRKGRRVRKTNVEKLEILAFVEQGGSQGAAAEKFGVSRTAVTKMVKEKEAISAQATSDSTNHRKVLQYQHKLSIIEDMLYKWQVQVEFEAPSLKVTGDLLQSKAMEFRNKILADFSSDLPDEVVVSLTDFKASNGWLHRYTQRRNVRSLSKNEHHSISADPSYVEKRMERIRTQLALAHVPLQCIWNIDEAVIRHRTTSSRTDATINLDSRSQEKLTVTFSVSAAGEKLNLQAIGANSQPASLKEVDPASTFGVHYHGQRKACQDSSTLMHFVNLMNHEARSRKQIWYILLDNCPSHMAAASILDPSGSYDSGFKVDSVVLIVLPPNSVSSLQPLQLGVIRSFKVAFRREMLRTILEEYAAWEAQQAATTEQNGDDIMPLSAFDIHSFTHTRNALLLLQRAWTSMTVTSIRQAWAKSNYLPTHLLPELSEDLSRPLDSSVYAEFVELLSVLSTKKHLLAALGLDGLDDTEQVAMELINLDDPEVSASGSNDDVNDDEIVMESLSAQGLIRESNRVVSAAQGENGGGAGMLASLTPDIASIGDACTTVEKLLRFMDKTSHEQVPATDRRAGRTNLLSLHRILLKARAKERSNTAYTV